MHTAAELSPPVEEVRLPEPRRMASRPVDSIAATMALGEAIPVIEICCVGREAVTVWIPNGEGG